MRLLILTGVLLFHFLMAPAIGIKAPASLLPIPLKKETHVSVGKHPHIPVAESIHTAPDINNATQQRRQLSTGGLVYSLPLLYGISVVAPAVVLQNKANFCIPIALRLLFPGHYFW